MIIFKTKHEEISLDNRSKCVTYIARDEKNGSLIADCWFTPSEAFITRLSLVKAAIMGKYKIPSDATIKRKQVIKG